ncbi:MAG: type II secretion system protein [Synergistaceae bacterium]|nr:type II secretion system protein [Synergistaceae bacterium]
MKRQKAFTLTELMISAAISLILMGAVVSALFIGLNIHEKSQANAQLANAVRLTMAAYEREVMPRVNHAAEIEILPDNSYLPMSLNSPYDYYLYLSGDSVIQWSDTKREPLGGSEFISSLSFGMKDAPAASADNYTLSADVAARHPKFDTVRLETGVKTALYNYETLIKSGDAGAVLHLVVGDRLALATDLHIRSADKSGKVIDQSTVSPGTVLYASYSLDVTPSPDYAVSDDSIVTWYISTTKDVSPAVNLTTQNPNTIENPGQYCWQLVGSGDNPITGLSLNTAPSGGFKVKVETDAGTSVVDWGITDGFIKYMISPRVENKNTQSEYITGPEAVSPWVYIGDPDSLWNLWATINDLDNPTEGFFNMADNKDFYVELDRKSGKTVAKLTGETSDTHAPSVVLAKMDGKYLKQQQQKSVEDDGKSYTSITNYSIIVDAELGNADGIGVLLNGRGRYSGSSQIKDTGLMFQIANKSDTMPLRLYADGWHHDGASGKSWGFGAHDNTLAYTRDEKYTSGKTYSKFTGNGKTNYSSNTTYGPFYGPGYLKNDEFKYTNDYYSNQESATIDVKYKGSNNRIKGEDLPPYNERMRFMLTVLEYYTSDDKSEPHFIVRFKLLKNESDSIGADDPDDKWKTGAKWFKSEPAWYGGFVGAKPQKTTSADMSATSKDYYVEVKNYSGYNGNKIYFNSGDLTLKTAAASPDKAELYVTKVHKGESDGDVVETLFEAKDINIYEEIGKNKFKVDNAYLSEDKKEAAKKLFDTTSGDRHIGLRIWSNRLGLDSSDPYSVTVYGVELAPGFSKKELQAIMPAGAKIYEAEDTKEKNLSNIELGKNSSLFVSGDKSDGRGNGTDIADGVMGIQYNGTKDTWYGFPKQP